MPTPVIMPKAGMAMESGIILRWLKDPGDTVAKGEILFEIETDKATMEIEAEAGGVLLAVLHSEGATVPVTDTVGWIGKPGETVPQVAAAPPAPAASDASAAPPPAHGMPARTAHPQGRRPATPAAKRIARERGIDLDRVAPSHPDGALRVRDVAVLAALRVTPLARKLAAAKGVDLRHLAGSGHAGKIVAADVEQAAASQPRRLALSGMRQVIARRMAQSHADVPDATLTLSADVTALFSYRAMLKQSGTDITVNDLILRATALALSEFPTLNATFEQDTILCWPDVNLGVAVAVENGLVVPVLHRIQHTPLPELAALARQTVARARAGKLPPDAYLQGTFTVTNLGMLGIEHFTPIINPPQTAILGVCAAEERPVRHEGGLAWRTMMRLCLTHDHRVIDGAVGATFLNRVKDLLTTPDQLADPHGQTT
jgi:pyruvate dehydrogenase E2 component (dihydrolipoamide acetyltransferase)